jgi:hypothetical protein
MKFFGFFLNIITLNAQQNFQEQVLNNLKYLPEEFFKLYFYIINYHNTIPSFLLKEYPTINGELLKLMERQGYKIVLNREKNQSGYGLNLAIVGDPITKIYSNNIKKYIKFYIPQNNKKPHYYKNLKNNTIDDHHFVFLQDGHRWILGTDKKLYHCCPINHSNVIHSFFSITQLNQWSFLTTHQKKMFFIEKVQYKKKPQYLILKVFYTNDLNYSIDKSNNGPYLKMPNIFNPSTFIQLQSKKNYTTDGNNPEFIVAFNGYSLIHKKDTIHQDIPLISYLIALSENNQDPLKSVENIYVLLKKTHDLKKNVDLFPVKTMEVLTQSNFNGNFTNYMDMIVNFYYGKYKQFNWHFNQYYQYNYSNFFPLINNLKHMNEPLFWLMINLLPYNPISKDNILKMVEYSYGFPSVIRDKINSYIIYHLYLNNQWHTINYLFNNNLIDVTLDFLTNFIYVETKIFNGMEPGQEPFQFNQPLNIVKGHLKIQQLLYSNYDYDQSMAIKIKTILDIYKTYKIILSKDDQNQLLDLLAHWGSVNFKLLEQLIQNSKSIINMNLIIHYVKIHNPKLFKKHYESK